MRRRDFLNVLGGAAATPAFALRRSLAQERPIPVIGYLSSKDETAEAGIVAAIRKGLAERGLVEGSNVRLAFRLSSGDYSQLPQLAAGLVNDKVDVIAASGLPATLAAKQATATIPIVFRLAIDPVAFHLADSFDHPGGNMTGVTMLFDPLTPKKLQLLHELVPTASKIGFLVNPNNQNAASHQAHAKQAAATLGLVIAVLQVGRADDVEAAFAAGRRQGIAALLVGDDPLFDVLNPALVGAAARFRIPTMFYVRDFVVAGGLISYGPSFDEMAKQVGIYLGRILQGAKPAELPVQQPTKIELVVNLKAAKALGMVVPSTLLTGADEVIE